MQFDFTSVDSASTTQHDAHLQPVPLMVVPGMVPARNWSCCDCWSSWSLLKCSSCFYFSNKVGRFRLQHPSRSPQNGHGTRKEEGTERRRPSMKNGRKRKKRKRNKRNFSDRDAKYIRLLASMRKYEGANTCKKVRLQSLRLDQLV